jgi:hypothetical protein
MADPTYEPPEITEIGTLHELTLLLKDQTGVDGVILAPNIPLGPVS